MKHEAKCTNRINNKRVTLRKKIRYNGKRPMRRGKRSIRKGKRPIRIGKRSRRETRDQYGMARGQQQRE